VSWKQRVAIIAKVLAIFLILGPPAGAIAFFVGLGLHVFLQSGDVAGLMWLPLFGIIYAVPLSYLIGAFPALVAGLVLSVAAASGYRPGILFSAVTGTAVGLGLAYYGGRPISVTATEGNSDNATALILVGTCLAATLICWVLARAVVKRH